MRPEPGIYPGVPMQTYLSWDCPSYSVLKHFRRSPVHARAAMLEPDTEPTRAMLVGEALDCGLLTPADFPARYGLPPKVNRRSNAGKAEWAAWEEANPGFVSLTSDEFEAVEGMLASVGTHALASAILAARGQNQLSIVWEDPDTGVRLKGRPDTVRLYGGHTFVPDVKTTHDAGPWKFGKTVHDLAYHWQAAMYLDGLDVLKPHRRRFLHIVVESKKPHPVAIYELSEAAIAQGRDAYKAALRTLVQCQASGDWPGYPQRIEPLDLPKYATGVEVVEDEVEAA